MARCSYRRLVANSHRSSNCYRWPVVSAAAVAVAVLATSWCDGDAGAVHGHYLRMIRPPMTEPQTLQRLPALIMISASLLYNYCCCFRTLANAMAGSSLCTISIYRALLVGLSV